MRRCIDIAVLRRDDTNIGMGAQIINQRQKAVFIKLGVAIDESDEFAGRVIQAEHAAEPKSCIQAIADEFDLGIADLGEIFRQQLEVVYLGSIVQNDDFVPSVQRRLRQYIGK